jgi:Fur family ferric uptake transcriptional regulator
LVLDAISNKTEIFSLIEFGSRLGTIRLADLEQKFEKADKVTLYRAVKPLEENKLIHSIDDGTGSIKYVLKPASAHPEDLHVHFFVQNANKRIA